MKRVVLFLVKITVLIACAVPSGTVFALDVPIATSLQAKIVVSQIYIGNASQPRLVELYNNSDIAVDMTNWCVRYHVSSTPSDAASERNCIRVDDNLYRAVLPARTHMAFLQADLNGGLGTGASGRVYITNAANEVVDVVSWNTTPTSDDFPMPVNTAERPRILERKMTDVVTYQDTNKNGDDIFASALRAEYTVDTITDTPDYCVNLDGLQMSIPDGLEQGEGYTCLEPAPVCKNMPEIRIDALPDSFEVDDEGNCYEDMCSNLEGFQAAVPNEFKRIDATSCFLDILPLQITEVLPNPLGTDTNNEFIELYNPNDRTVDMMWWSLYINDDFAEPHSLPVNTLIAPKSYFVYKNSFTLTNTEGMVRLQSVEGQHFIDVPTWSSAKDNQSWALIDGEWQYTTVVTPGSENVASPTETSSVVTGTLADCGEGRERNPVTNRCRNVVVASSLKPCAEGQYRSEETNRCRSIIASMASILKPCADDQFRNPVTNRCKKIASDEDVALADCGEGRERNPETNRCRNVLGVSTKSAALPYPVEETPEGAEQFAGWWVLGTIAIIGAGYGIWEWRVELLGTGRRATRFVTGKK